jgi:replicative DNA helicase
MSVEAERSIVGRMLRDQRTIAEVTAARLSGDEFQDAALKYLFNTLVENFYADDPVDAVSIAALGAPFLARVWDSTPDAARQRVLDLGSFTPTGRAADHIALVKRAANSRTLGTILHTAMADLKRGDAPEEVAGRLSQEAVAVATGAVTADDTIEWQEAGRRLVADTRMRVAAKERGVEMGVKFGIGAVDTRTHGLQPTELLIAGGEPGVGKSGVWWRAGMNFADMQSRRPKHQRVGTAILSLEMGEAPSSQRVASMQSGIELEKFREATISEAELRKVAEDWGRRDYPLVFSHRTGLKASGLRALISDHVLRHNVGLVIIDHFNLFDMDDPPRNKVDHDEDKVKFLKNQIAKAMNLAVVCLAHTRKIPEERKGRPGPSDLRGSDQIRAHADFLNFLYRPGLYATEEELESNPLLETEAMFIWGKNRHGNTADSRFHLDAKYMTVF